MEQHERDLLGELVRLTWQAHASTRPDCKPSWLASYAALSEDDKEADRRIGEAVLSHAYNKVLKQLYNADWPPAPLLSCTDISPIRCCGDCHSGNGAFTYATLVDGRPIWLCCHAQTWFEEQGFLAAFPESVIDG